MNLLRQIFTVQNVVAWLVINCFCAGGFCIWVWARTQLFGIDVVAVADPGQQIAAMTKRR